MLKSTSRSSVLSADLKLIQAVSDFEADLPADQKIEMAVGKDHTPAVEDVKRLTAEIDRGSSAKTFERRRCYGPRTIIFLEGIQQFAAIADVAIGGSQIPVASGVWSVASTKYSPYIEKLSELFMSLGQQTPRLKELADMYSHSSRVRDSIIEYYIVVVKLCHEILKLSKQSPVTQIFSSFATDTYTDKSAKAFKAIKREIEHENIRLKKQDRIQNNAFIRLSKEEMALKAVRLQQKRRGSILEACSRHDYQRIWKQIRRDGNTVLFAENAEYGKWLGSAASCTLLYSGKLGSGKSVLLANIVDDLHLRDGLKVAYFFCRYDNRESLKARTVIGCLVKQILQRLPDAHTFGATIEGVPTQLDLEEILQLLEGIESTLKVYFVLDGVDDMEMGEAETLLHSISHIQGRLRLMACISTRKHANTLFGNSCFPKKLMETSMPKFNQDIVAFIENEIQYRISSNDLRVSDPTLAQDIQKTLLSKADGMFLWVRLQITTLCLMETDYDIRQALNDLPTGLSETYSRLLKSQTKSRYRQTMLELILSAFEPLTITQLIEAIAVEAGNIQFDASRRLNDIETVLRSCAGLIIVDEEEDTARFIHHSAQQFLTAADHHEYSISGAAANLRMTETILTYLNYSELETQLTRYKPGSTLEASVIPKALILNTVPLASNLLRLSRGHSSETRLMSTSHSSATDQHTLKTYAYAYWDLHLLSHEPSEMGLELLKSILRSRRVDLTVEHGDLTPLQRAVKCHRISVLKVFLKCDIRAEDKKRALRQAAAARNEEVLDILTMHISDLDYLFSEAIANDQISLLKSILRQDTLATAQSINCVYQSLQGYTPLSFAIFRQKVDMVEILLLDRRINLHTSSRLQVIRRSYSSSGSALNPLNWSSGPPISIQKPSPLNFAVESGLLQAVVLFSAQEKVKNDYRNADARHILWRSAVREWSGPWVVDTESEPIAPCEEIVRVLLEHGILYASDRFKIFDTSPLCKANIPSLMMAARYNRVDIVKALLDFDSRNVNDIQNGRLGRLSRFTAWDMASNRETKRLIENYGGKSVTDL